MSNTLTPFTQPPPPRLRVMGVLAAAKASTRRELEDKSILRIFDIGAQVWKNGDDQLAVIQSGRCRQQLMLETGQAMTLAFLNAGDLAGLFESSAEKRLATVYSATSVLTAVFIPVAAMRTAMDIDMELRSSVEKHLSLENVKLRQRLFEMATLPIQGRLASYLLEECSKNPASEEIKNPLTHEELASLLGTNREAITRTLRVFEKLGLVVYSRQRIKMIDMIKLKALRDVA